MEWFNPLHSMPFSLGRSSRRFAACLVNFLLPTWNDYTYKLMFYNTNKLLYFNVLSIFTCLRRKFLKY